MRPLGLPRKLAYLLFAVIMVATIVFHLGTSVLTGLFSFMILDLTHRPLSRHMKRFAARWLSMVIFVVVATGLTWLMANFLKLSFAKLPDILDVTMPKVDDFTSYYGIDLPFENLKDLRAAAIEAVKENAQTITKASGVLTRSFFQIIVGVFAAILFFLAEADSVSRPHLLDAVRREFAGRVRLFMQGFEVVFGAQFAISAVNTLLTAGYLYFMDLPYFKFLTISTFILGVIPVIGLAISNTLIFFTGLMVSPQLAVGSLFFLIVLHKLEFFLRSHFIGMGSNIPMWQVLLTVLFGEAVMGVAGVILAPAVLQYVRDELQLIEYET